MLTRKELKLSNMKLREIISENNPDAMMLDGFDDALIGMSECHKAVYSIEAIISILVNDQEMDLEDAWDYYGYNIACAYVGEFTPLYVYIYTNERIYSSIQNN
jgi:hypothetical protein